MEPGSRGQDTRLETINSLLHGFGILFGLISMPVLIAHASKDNNFAGIAGSAIYGFCFLLLFSFSTLYHGFQQPKIKERLKILDHISIYFLIAGTYTPIILIFVNNSFGFTLLAILWGLTVAGIFFKIFFTGRFEIVSVIVYILMGWISFAGGETFFAAMPPAVIILIITGGALYCIGVIFYLWQKYTYHHAIWHIFVLAAAICHYVAVLISV
ncbi:MAG: hemolysin III family protein [Ferruginibacter sp.]|nr:hemolysin III family protein [Ferruginibacter sp.]